VYVRQGRWLDQALAANENAGVRCVIPHAEILADDARIAAKDPRRSNAPRPGSIKYIALSAVGFNAARTKALVYVRFRTSHFSDGLLMKELKDGKWVTGPRGCAGAA